jgi:hypothetical protein
MSLGFQNTSFFLLKTALIDTLPKPPLPGDSTGEGSRGAVCNYVSSAPATSPFVEGRRKKSHSFRKDLQVDEARRTRTRGKISIWGGGGALRIE